MGTVRTTSATGLLVNGTWRQSGESLAVLDKYRGTPYAALQRAHGTHADDAVAAAVDTAATGPLPPRQRAEILRGATDLLRAWKETIVRTYVAETGFTLADAHTELTRTLETVRLSAEEAERLTGEAVPLEASPGGEHRMGFTIRVPVGVVCAISPFNAPLNTVAHKVAPALAAGNAVVLKPAATTPLCATLLCQALLAAGLPPGWLNMLVGTDDEVGEQLIADQRIRYFTFTGSSRVGLRVKQHSGLAKTHLELGSISSTIVCGDADLEQAARLIAQGGFRKAGQVCTSVQRVLVAEEVASELAERLLRHTEILRVGDPTDPATNIGPMISESEAKRAQELVDDALNRGGRRLIGGRQEGSLLWPTVLEQVPSTARLQREEIFAPVIALTHFERVTDALEAANATDYGLQAGIFTRDVDTAFLAARLLRVGGVMINDTSSFHADLMPYGGVKQSGYGLEGPRYAVRDMTDPRLIVLNLAPAPPTDLDTERRTHE